MRDSTYRPNQSDDSRDRSINDPGLRQEVLVGLVRADPKSVLSGLTDQAWREPIGAIGAASVINEFAAEFDDDIVKAARALLTRFGLSTEPGAFVGPVPMPQITVNIDFII